MLVARIGSVLSQIAELSELGPNLGPNGHIRAAGGVGHVVLFEFPPDAKAYIARVGFATRGHAPPARVTALAVAKQLPFAKAMLEQDRGGKRIDLDLI